MSETSSKEPINKKKQLRLVIPPRAEGLRTNITPILAQPQGPSAQPDSPRPQPEATSSAPRATPQALRKETDRLRADLDARVAKLQENTAALHARIDAVLKDSLMMKLDESPWDVVIAGTGLYESLLALALSRSGKEILHVDKNNYYGGADTALTLQEAETWALENSENASASIQKPSPGEDGEGMTLSFPRAYSLALSPQLIYAQSSLLATLVSSRVDQHLEFLAVGSAFVFSPDAGVATSSLSSSSSHGPTSNGTLIRVPNSREDVFADDNLDPKHKRGLMKFLRFMSDFEDQQDIWEAHKSDPFDDFLLTQFNLPPVVQRPLHALTLSPSLPHNTSTSFAVPRIARHLRSIGLFGPGFGSVIPKWGGLSEIAQVGCRACAVGGGVYVLGNGINELKELEEHVEKGSNHNITERKIEVSLRNGETVKTSWVVMSADDTPKSQTSSFKKPKEEALQPERMQRSIHIVSSSLNELFPQIVDGAPAPAVAVILIPSSTMVTDQPDNDAAPIYMMAHSSDTGECPVGQTVLYTSTAASRHQDASMLDAAVSTVLESLTESPKPKVLWSLQYELQSSSSPDANGAAERLTLKEGLIVFPPPPLDIAFDDVVLRRVHEAWRSIMGDDGADFMTFPEREGFTAEGDEDDD